MNVQNKNHHVILVLILAFFTSMSAFADKADKAEKVDEKEAMPIVSIRTFDVKADAEGFMKMMDKAIKKYQESCILKATVKPRLLPATWHGNTHIL